MSKTTEVIDVILALVKGVPAPLDGDAEEMRSRIIDAIERTMR